MSESNDPHFVVLRKEQIGNLGGEEIGYADADAALDFAEKKTSGDREPRYVVQVLCLVEVDPKPRVIVHDLRAGVAA